MGKRKAIGAVLLALAAALLLACAAFFTACGSDDSPGGEDGPQNSAEYTVTFVADGKTVGTDTYTEKDKTITEPAVPSKDGYTGEWEDYTLTTGDITVEAEYEPIQYTITFVNGEEEVDTVHYTVEDKNITEPPVPTRDGYTGEWEDYTLTTGDFTVEAEYTIIVYTITFVADGRTVGTDTFTIEDKNIVEPDVPQKDGFVGAWEEYELACKNMQVEAVYKAEIEYTLTADKSFYVVSKYIGMGTSVELPAIYNGLRVKEIAERAFSESPNLKEISMPNTIETIGAYAFSDCSLLEKVYIPDSVKEIGEGAFSGCIVLNTINTIERAEEVGAKAFSGCSALKEIAFGTSLRLLEESAFENCYSLQKVSLSAGVEKIGDMAFDNCIALKEILLPASLTQLGVASFRHAESLEEIVLPSLLTTVPNAAFQYCISLNEIVLPEKINSIGSSAFSYCTSLQSVQILGDVNISDSAFYNCTDITSIYYASGTAATYGNEKYIFYNAGTNGGGIALKIAPDARIPEGLFEPHHKDNAPKITSIEWEEGVRSLNCFAVYNYLPYLKSVTIPAGVRSINNGLLEACKDLIETEGGVSYLDRCAIACDAASEYVQLRQDTNSILNTTFVGHTSLRSLSIPDSIESIADGLLSGCSSLTDLTIPFIGACVVSESDMYQYPLGYIFGTTSYEGGDSVEQTYYGSSTAAVTSTNFYIPASLRTVNVLGGNILGGAFYNCAKLTNITIPEGVTKIGESAFRNCSGLTNIAIPEGVTEIGESAFYNCSGLTNIAIPEVVTEIGESAFYNCSGLTNIAIPEVVTEIGESAFYNCSGLTNIVVPEGTESIGAGAFRGCTSLQSITLPFVGKERNATAYEAVFGYIFGYTTVIDGSNTYGVSNAFINRKYGNVSDAVWQYTCNNYNSGSRRYYQSYWYYIPTSLSEVVVTGAERINDAAFNGCMMLKTIMLPGGVVDLGQYSFCNCSGLTNITIPEGVTEIGESAFYNCSGLISVTIPFSVEGIGNNAFANCGNLVLNTIYPERPSGWSASWNGNRPVNWNSGSGMVTYHFESNGGPFIEDIESEGIIELPAPNRLGYIFIGWCDNSELKGTVYSGNYYNPAGATLYAKWEENTDPAWEQSEGLAIENGYIVGIGTCTDEVLILNMPIAERAFRGCDTITKVIFGTGVTSIGEHAFGDSGIGCDNLTEVIFLSPVPTGIGSDIFGSTWNHAKDFDVYVPQGSLEAYLAVDDPYWQQYLVEADKIHEITGEIII